MLTIRVYNVNYTCIHACELKMYIAGIEYLIIKVRANVYMHIIEIYGVSYYRPLVLAPSTSDVYIYSNLRSVMSAAGC